MYCAEVLNIDSTPEAVPCRHGRAVPGGRSQDGSRTLAVFTLVLWMSCVVIGVLGFELPYGRPQPPKPEPAPIQASFLNVELSNDPLPELAPPPVAPAALPPPAAAVLQPQTALFVAEPSPAIAFAVPVAAAANVTDAAQASYTVSDAAKSSTAGPAQILTFGRGEGKQPAPEYPLMARRQGQQGPVKVLLTVGADGRVVSASVSEGSQWPLLNDSALRTVRQRWKFSPGKVRVFEVLIRFELNS